jgi:CHASE2 domain-containing sensor protein
VANRLTRVPATPPPLDRTQLWLLPLADLFMALMWSRPGGLSLRTTWVTPATIWLCVAVALLGAGLTIAAMAYAIASLHLLTLAAALLALLIATGTGSVAAYGIRQRRLARRSNA